MAAPREAQPPAGPGAPRRPPPLLRALLRFGTFALASLLLHALVLTRLPLLDRRTEEPLPVLTATLLPPPAPAPEPGSEPTRTPEPAPAARAAARPAARPRPAPPKPVARAALPTAPAEEVESAVRTEEAAFDAQDAPVAEAAASPALAPARGAEAVQKTAGTVVQTGAAGHGEPEEADAAGSSGGPALPPRGRIHYEVYFGADRFAVGRTVVRWEIEAGRYRIESVSETTGIASLLRPYQFDSASEGRVVDGALRPEWFSVKRGRGAERQYEVRLDWRTMTATLVSSAGLRRAELSPGTLDVLSLMFQIGRSDLTPGRRVVRVTNGNKLADYTLDVGSEEPIDTPMGPLQAVPVRQVRTPGDEAIEFWLAPAYLQLPVRVRFVGRDGETSGEQLAQEIRADAP